MTSIRTYTEPQKTIKLYGDYDVVVAGGGVAGFAAAVASARNKAKTLIIERFPFFGGTATASLMASINAFRNQKKPDYLQTSKGIAEEVILRLKKIGGLGRSCYEHIKEYPNTKGKLSYSFAIDTEKFKFVTLQMAKEAGLHILFHTWFSDVIMKKNRAAGVIFENKSGRQAAYGKVIIDATGDGDVAFKAGVPCRQTRHDEKPRLSDNLMYKIGGYTEDHPLFGSEAGGWTVVWGPNVGCPNGADADELTEAEIKARLEVYKDFQARQKKMPFLKNAQVIETPPLIGIRQTRFIKGLYTLNGDDVLKGRRFDDVIALGSAPVIHYFGYRRYLEHEGYDIPYRCLIPKKINGLIVTGRCMSSDQVAYESWRAMAPVMSISEAAGTAAALSAKAGVDPKDLDIKTLQHQLIKQGAEIGQGRGKKSGRA